MDGRTGKETHMRMLGVQGYSTGMPRRAHETATTVQG